MPIREKIKGEVTFDTVVADEGQDHIEGCYRINASDWKVFYFTHWDRGNLWWAEPQIRKDAVWQSGITGVDVVYPKDRLLNKATVIRVLSEVLDVDEWSEVRGPDSLQLK